MPGKSSGGPRVRRLWFLFYGGFVIAVSVHGAIGLRVIAFEWGGLKGVALEAFMWLRGSWIVRTGSARRLGRDICMSVRGIASRTHPLWLAYILHRLSGLALAVFLPMHFWVLAMALTEPGRLDGFLALTEAGVVKLAEFGLVFLLAVHMFGGLRLMAMEFLPWRPAQKTLAAGAAAVAFLVAGLFLMRAV